MSGLCWGVPGRWARVVYEASGIAGAHCLTYPVPKGSIRDPSQGANMSVPANCRLYGRGIPVIAAVMLWISPCSSASAQGQKQVAMPAALSPDLDAARAALEKYQDPVLAVHDGY